MAKTGGMQKSEKVGVREVQKILKARSDILEIKGGIDHKDKLNKISIPSAYGFTTRTVHFKIRQENREGPLYIKVCNQDDGGSAYYKYFYFQAERDADQRNGRQSIIVAFGFEKTPSAFRAYLNATGAIWLEDLSSWLDTIVQ